jgi:hypothetical protein
MILHQQHLARIKQRGRHSWSKEGAPSWRAWLLASRSRDSSSVLQPCFANVLAYFRFDDLLACRWSAIGREPLAKTATRGQLLAPKRPSIEPADYLLAGAKLMLSRRCRTAAAPPITRCSIACSLRSARARLSSPKAAAHLVNQRRADTRYIISQACRRCAGPRNKRLRRVHESSVPQDIRRSNG